VPYSFSLKMARFRTVAGFFPWVAAHAVFGTPHRKNATFGVSILRRPARVVLRQKGRFFEGERQDQLSEVKAAPNQRPPIPGA
jgi:hypothetical protein